MTQPIVRRELLRLVRDAAPAVAPASGAGAADPKASRVRRFVASTDAVDSYNTTLNPDGWELGRYARNPIVPLMHRTHDFPIGVGKAWVESKRLMIDVEFAASDDPVSGAEAEQALRWVDRGVMGVSVGFLPLEEEYNEDRETGDIWQDLFFPPIDYKRQELLEVSVVTVPANPDAVAEGRHLRSAPVSAALLERIRRELGAKPPAAKEPELNVKDLVAEIVREEVRAAAARKSGKISGG